MNDQRSARAVGDSTLAPPHGDGAAVPPPDAAGVLASISDGIIAVDNDWRIVYLNAAAERLWGRDAKAVIGRTIHEALDISADNPFRAVYTASKLNAEPVVFSGYSEMFGAWVDVRGYPHPGGYTILFRLATEERGRAGAVQESERERTTIRSINQRIFDTSLDLILVVGKRGEFLRVSPSSRTILGYAPEEMTGRNGVEFVFAADLDNTRAEMRHARRDGKARNFECRYVHKDGRAVPVAWKGIWSEAGRAVLLHRPRHDGPRRAGESAAPGAEDGSDRAADRRRRARLQQSADRHHRDVRAADRLGRARSGAGADRAGDR